MCLFAFGIGLGIERDVHCKVGIALIQRNTVHTANVMPGDALPIFLNPHEGAGVYILEPVEQIRVIAGLCSQDVAGVLYVNDKPKLKNEKDGFAALLDKIICRSDVRMTSTRQHWP